MPETREETKIMLRPRNILLAVALVAMLSASAHAQAKLTKQGKTHVGGKASGIVTLFASAIPGATASFDVVSHDGTHGPFAVPPKMVLVVTDVVVRTLNSASNGRVRGSVRVPGGTVSSIVFDFDTSQQKEQHLPLVSGTVMGAAPVVSADLDSQTLLIFMYGYLAADK